MHIALVQNEKSYLIQSWEMSLDKSEHVGMEAFLATPEHCLDTFRSLDTITPRSFSSVTSDKFHDWPSCCMAYWVAMLCTPCMTTLVQIDLQQPLLVPFLKVQKILLQIVTVHNIYLNLYILYYGGCKVSLDTHLHQMLKTTLIIIHNFTDQM